MNDRPGKPLPRTRRPNLFARVAALVEEARRKVAAVANVAQVYTNYEIGRLIVEEEQGGKRRAEYGKQILIDLSQKLTARFGRGWSAENLRKMRTFFLLYSEIHNSVVEIDRGEIHNGVVEIQDDRNSATQLRKSDSEDSANTVCEIPKFTLSWSHYLVLMRIADREARAFYEREAREGQWSLRQLSRQIGSQLYERVLQHQGKTNVKELMRKAPKPEVAEDPLKDPYTLEFLGLPEQTDYSETQLEQAIIDHLAEFMLELGKGFTFVGRQIRLTFEEEHYKVDLVFYNRLTRSFFVFDLKLSKITHQDLGQMQMYVHYYDRVIKLPDENPTIGILLSSEEVNDATVKLTLPECEQNRIFARQYKTVLPSQETFKRILRQQRIAFQNKAMASSPTPPPNN